MPCDTRQLSAAERLEMERARKELEAEIAAGERALTRNYFGQYSIVGYSSTAAYRAGWCEGCVLSKISKEGGYFARAKLEAAGISNEFYVASHAGHPHKAGR